MDFVENIGVGKERAEAGFCAKQDCPSAIFDAWIVRGIGITEDTSAQGDELTRARFGFCCHE